MAIFHISGAGNDGNAGTSKATAFRTIQQALSSATEDSTIYVWSGIYFGTWAVPNYNMKIIGKEPNKFDAEGVGNFVTSYADKHLYLYNLDFYDWQNYVFAASSAWAKIWANNCVFARTGDLYGTGNNKFGYNYGFQCNLRSCTFFGLPWIRFHESFTDAGEITNCIGYGTTYWPECYVRNCAQSGANWAYDNQGSFSIGTYPPPFVSSDTANPDFRFDSNHAQYTKYMTGGEFGMPIGAIRGLGADGTSVVHGQAIWQFSAYNRQPASDMDQAGQLGAWANHEDTFDTSFDTQYVQEDINDNIDFVDDGGTHVATLTAGTYTDGASLASDVQTQMNAVASDTITCIYSSSSGKIQISSDGTSEFSILWGTGTNNTTNAVGPLGYSLTDNTGEFSYTSNEHLLAGGDDFISSAIWDDSLRAWTINFSAVADATTADVVSPVIDQFVSKTTKFLFTQEYLEGSGSIAIYYRTSDTLFSMQDSSPTWVSATKGTEITADNVGRYIQYKTELNI